MQEKFASMEEDISMNDYEKWSAKFTVYAKNISRQEHIIKLNKGQATQSYHHAPATTPVGDPMDLDATRMGGISDATRRYRMEHNLCMACGESGHFAADHRGPNAIPMPPRTASTASPGRSRGGNPFNQPFDPARGGSRG